MRDRGENGEQGLNFKISKINLEFWLVAMTDSKLVSKFRICAMLMMGSFLVVEA